MKTVPCTVCSLAVLTWFGGYDVIEASSIPAAAQRSVRVGTSHLVDSLRVLRNQIKPPSEETDQDDVSSETGDVSYTEPGTHTSLMPRSRNRGGARVDDSHLVDSLRGRRNQIKPPSEETDQDDLSSDTGDVSYTEPGTQTSLMPRSRDRGGAQVGLSHLSNLLRVLRSQITDASSDDDGDSDSDDHAGA